MQAGTNGAEVFVSYSREDIERALDIARHLEAAGVNLWIDKRGIQGSQNWRAKITRAIRACEILAVLCSESSMRSRYVRREIELADDFERSFLPIHLENAEYPDEIHFCLVGANFIEVLDQPIEDWLPEVLEALDAKGIHCDTSYRPPPVAVQAAAVPSEEPPTGAVEAQPAEAAPAEAPRVYREGTGLERVFRIFVDSTFADLNEELNALQSRVFPRLRELCLSHGFRFEAPDTRWGVSQEASLDQQTMSIVLAEIDRCQRISPRPNYIALLGDRYGWRPLPSQIPADEFELILDRVSDNGDRELLQRWYTRDDNALPPECCLQPREKYGPFEDWVNWAPVERRLRSILVDAVRGTTLEEDPKYVASATEQGVVRGALTVEDAREHVFCFLRTIDGLPGDRSAIVFGDLDDQGRPDLEAAARLEDLKARLRERLPGNVFEYTAHWNGEAPTYDHLDQLCDDVYECLSRVIREQIDRRGEVDLLDEEVVNHEHFGGARGRNFIGRQDVVERIGDYISGVDPHPLAIYGAFGSGQSPLIARVAQDARQKHPDSEVVRRFIGATPQSVEGRTLLASLCHEISRRYAVDESGVPTDYSELVDDFPKRLALASASRPLLIFLDALDQLSDADGARSLVWLPSELPEHVRFVVSTIHLPKLAGQPIGLAAADPLAALRAKLPEDNLIELGTMPREEGGALLDAWLAEAGRALTDDQRAEVLGKFEIGGSPLYLRLAFEEARRWKSYTPAALSGGIEGIVRENLLPWLMAPENHGEILVSRTLSYLAAAKNGLSEDELVDLLSRDDAVLGDFWRRSPMSPAADRLPVAVWSRLYFDLEPYLSRRAADGAELMTFSHRYLHDVVEEEYLAGDEGRERHRQLAAYFADQPLEHGANGAATVNLRRLSELPYQQTYGELWDDLVLTLTDFDFLERKAAHAGVIEAVDPEGRMTRTYTGAYLLQDDYALALERMPGGGGDANGGRRRIFVTGTDLGAGLELQCPHCKQSSGFREEWRGEDISCPSCEGPLRVNEAVVERHGSPSATGRPK
jgi:hypothetical protein